MKRQLLFCALLAGGASVAQAQMLNLHKEESSLLSSVDPHDPHTPSGKATAMKSRMVGYSYNPYNTSTSAYVLGDSAIYTYSGDRGGDNFSQDYDTQIDYTLSSGKVVPSSRRTITYIPGSFNAYSMIIVQSWDAPTSSWTNSVKATFLRDAAERIYQDSSFVWDKPTSSWIPSSANTYNVRPSGKYNFGYNMQFNTGTSKWDTTSFYVYNLDASENYTDYVYRARIGGVLRNTTRNTYSYNSAGVTTGVITQSWSTSSSTWLNSSKSQYDINSHGDREKTYSFTWNSGTSKWDSSSMGVYVYDASFFCTSATTKVYNKSTLTFANKSQYLYTKNSYNQATSLVTGTWNVGGFWEKSNGDYKENYWYEEFMPTAISSVKQNNGNIKVYPVPAQSELTVEINAGNNDLFNITVLDQLGRTVMLQSNAALQNNAIHIDVSQLPAGSYTLVMNDQTGEKYSSKFSIAR